MVLNRIQHRLLAPYALMSVLIIYGFSDVCVAQPIKPHLNAERKLAGLLGSEPKMHAALQQFRLKTVNGLAEDFGTELELIRNNLNQAMLTGKWKPAYVRHRGQKIIDRLESTTTLCMIARYFSSDYYQHPERYVPDSVDAVLTKMFMQVAALHEDVKRVNDSILYSIAYP